MCTFLATCFESREAHCLSAQPISTVYNKKDFESISCTFWWFTNRPTPFPNS